MSAGNYQVAGDWKDIENNDVRFPGQYYDGETGFHYNYFRYYNPQTGRYITPDPTGLAGGINLFAYVANAPTRLIDPWGLQAGYRGIRGLMMRLGEKRSRKAIEDFFDSKKQRGSVLDTGQGRHNIFSKVSHLEL